MRRLANLLQASAETAERSEPDDGPREAQALVPADGAVALHPMPAVVPVSEGNFQMLPRPMAEPRVAAMTPRPVVKPSRGLSEDDWTAKILSYGIEDQAHPARKKGPKQVCATARRVAGPGCRT